MRTAESAILEFKAFGMSYRSRHGIVRAVIDASLVVRSAETVGLVGESGSGKSTLARAALGLLPEGIAQVDHGEILISGGVSTSLTQQQWEARRGNPIAIVFQDPLAFLNPVMRVRRQIAESVERHDRSQDVDHRVDELLGLVKLSTSCRDMYPHELSGGMRQRVLLAIALACRPRLLIADEPTTALDVTTQSEILALLRELQRSLDMSVLMISHDLGIIASCCDRLYVMYAGATIEWGLTEDIFRRPAHPYASGLLAAAEAALDSQGQFVTIDGDVPNLTEEIVGCPFAPRCPHAWDKCKLQMPPKFSAPMAADHLARCWLLEPAR